MKTGGVQVHLNNALSWVASITSETVLILHHLWLKPNHLLLLNLLKLHNIIQRVGILLSEHNLFDFIISGPYTSKIFPSIFHHSMKWSKITFLGLLLAFFPCHVIILIYLMCKWILCLGLFIPWTWRMAEVCNPFTIYPFISDLKLLCFGVHT